MPIFFILGCGKIHCAYIFSVQQRPPPTTRQRDSTGSLEDFLYTIPEEDEVISDDIEDDDVPEISNDASPSNKSLEPQFKPVLIGNEKECKRKFAKMLHAAPYRERTIC
jgi:hypothetical protein